MLEIPSRVVLERMLGRLVAMKAIRVGEVHVLWLINSGRIAVLHATTLVQYAYGHDDLRLASLALALLLLLLLALEGSDEKLLVYVLFALQEQLVVDLVFGLFVRDYKLFHFVCLDERLKTFLGDDLHERVLRYFARLLWVVRGECFFHAILVLVHVIVDADGPVDAARLQGLLGEFGVLFLALLYVFARVLGLFVFGERLGRVAFQILRLGIAAASRQKAAAVARVRVYSQVYRVVAVFVVDVKVSAVC